MTSRTLLPPRGTRLLWTVVIAAVALVLGGFVLLAYNISTDISRDRAAASYTPVTPLEIELSKHLFSRGDIRMVEVGAETLTTRVWTRGHSKEDEERIYVANDAIVAVWIDDVLCEASPGRTVTPTLELGWRFADKFRGQDTEQVYEIEVNGVTHRFTCRQAPRK
jgi:hypothetical protein